MGYTGVATFNGVPDVPVVIGKPNFGNSSSALSMTGLVAIDILFSSPRLYTFPANQRRQRAEVFLPYLKAINNLGNDLKRHLIAT